MLIRVRSNVGVWRVEGLDDNQATVNSVLQGIAQTRPDVVYETSLSSDPACLHPLDPSLPLAAQGLRHGAMVHCRVDPTTCADHSVATSTTVLQEGSKEHTTTNMEASSTTTSTHMRRTIGKDGSIQLVPSNEVRAPGEDKGFRKGMLPLRDMKMQWTSTYLHICGCVASFNMCCVSLG